MQSKSILIVEDDISIQSVIKEALELNGYQQIHVANNGQEALDLLNSIDKPCLILLDVMMPIMDGWEFLKQVKEGHPNILAANIPIVVVSAAYNAEQLAIQRGAIGFVKKPIELDDLYKEVNRFCERSNFIS